MKRSTLNPRCFFWLLLLILFSCHTADKKKEKIKILNRRISLWRHDKIPYGTQVAYEGLPFLFPNAEITINRKSPSSLQTAEGKKVYIIITPAMIPDGSDINAILNFVGDGNHVFIAARYYGDSLLHALRLQVSKGNILYHNDEPDSLQLSIENPVTHRSAWYNYPGDSYDTWVTSLDTQFTTILGRNDRGYPNLVKFNYKGGGSLYLQFAPLAFSNFFVLYKHNRGYYENALSYLPDSTQEVIWDEYFRYDRSGPFSAFGYILHNKSLRWAFWLLLLLFLVIYLFDSKRRQRIVPVIAKLRNTSLDFVQTIGQLYYQKRDNHNLAMKMVAHFQDQVRTRYNLPVTNMDEAFVDRLAYKAGYGKDVLQPLITYMNELPERAFVPDEELQQFYAQLQEFYKLT